MHALQHPVFRWLFAAQIMSLLGIGIMTVGLALLAYDFGGVKEAGKILGALFALKMVVYVGLAPLAEAVLSRFEPKRILIGLDVFRLCVLLLFSLASEVWHLAGLALFFYTASAAFTPLYQAIIPSVLPDEKTYTSALVLSRLAYTFESMLSPLFAAIVLTLVTSKILFVIAAICLVGSVVALTNSGLSAKTASKKKGPFLDRLSRGLKIYFHTPRLRGLFVVNLALSFGLGWVLVNTVVFAGLHFDGSEQYIYLMIAFGTGSASAALMVPRLLQQINERRLMLFGGCLFGVLSFLIFLNLPFNSLLVLWFGFGVASSFVLTPGGLVLTRSAAKSDLPAVFAAQFSMSHAGWLLAYPAAGWLGSSLELELALGILGTACIVITIIGARIWPVDDPLERSHNHPELPRDHPHLIEHASTCEQRRHAHVFHIDDLHLKWN
jgi:MFS family permease